MGFSEEWYRNHARALNAVCRILRENEPDPDFYGTYFFHAVENGATLEEIVAAIRRDLNLPADNVPPLPSQDNLPPLVMGNWRGNFLYPAENFFGPACAAFSPDRRQQYFSSLHARGQTHVVINAEQDDWGSRKGRPEWTAGGYDAYDKLEKFVGVLREARSYGLSPVVGIIDQPTLRVLDMSAIVERS